MEVVLKLYVYLKIQKLDQKDKILKQLKIENEISYEDYKKFNLSRQY